MIDILYRIEAQRIRAKTQRRHALSGALSALLFTLICSTGYLVMQNAQADAESSYWEHIGESDVVAIFSNDSNRIASLEDSARSSVSAYFGATEVVTSSGANSVSAAVYGDIAAIDLMYGLEVTENVNNIEAIVNQAFLEHFDCAVGDVLSLSGIDYKIGAVSSKISSLFSEAKEPLVMINDAETKPVDASAIVLASFSHNRIDTQNAIQDLKLEDVSYVDLGEGIEAIEDEFSNLSSVLTVLFVVIAVVYSMLSYTQRLVEMKTESLYWKSMRIIGISRRTMFESMLVEGVLFSCLGGLIGCMIGSVVTFAICVLTDTGFSIWTLPPEAFAIAVALVVMISSGSTIIIGLKNRRSTPLDAIQEDNNLRSEKKSHRVLNSIVGVALVAAVGLSMLWYAPSDKATSIAFYSALLGAAVLSLILLSSTCSEVAGMLISRSRSKTVRMAAYTSRVGGVRMSRIALSLALCLSMVGMFLNFSYSFQSWARDLADKQLSFDIRAGAENTSRGQVSISSLISDDALEPMGVYYISVGDVAGMPAYIMSEDPQSDGFLNKLYQSDVSFRQLNVGEVVITKHLLSSLGLEIGDSVSVALNGESASLTVVSAINPRLLIMFRTSFFLSILVRSL